MWTAPEPNPDSPGNFIPAPGVNVDTARTQSGHYPTVKSTPPEANPDSTGAFRNEPEPNVDSARPQCGNHPGSM